MYEGDLISRVEMLEALGHFNDYVNGDLHFLNGIETAKEIAENLPAVDAVPVVHAKWKSAKVGVSNNYPFWDSKCSECGYTTAMTQTGWLYCPHCGAKMMEG